MNGSPAPSVDVRLDKVTFNNFDAYNDYAATVALLQKEKALLERQPGTKDRAKKIRALESLMARFSASSAPNVVTGPANRKEKRMAKRLRRKAARADQMRK